MGLLDFDLRLGLLEVALLLLGGDFDLILGLGLLDFDLCLLAGELADTRLLAAESLRAADCLTGDLRLGLPDGTLSTLLLMRGEGEGERGERLLPRPPEGDVESLLTGDLCLRDGGGEARLPGRLRAEVSTGGEVSLLAFGLRDVLPL